MYEKVKKNYFSNNEKDSQIMLLPDIINLNNKEMGIFRDNFSAYYDDINERMKKRKKKPLAMRQVNLKPKSPLPIAPSLS